MWRFFGGGGENMGEGKRIGHWIESITRQSARDHDFAQCECDQCASRDTKAWSWFGGNKLSGRWYLSTTNVVHVCFPERKRNARQNVFIREQIRSSVVFVGFGLPCLQFHRSYSAPKLLIYRNASLKQAISKSACVGIKSAFSQMQTRHIYLYALYDYATD